MKGKKTKRVLIIGVLDIPEPPSKCKDRFSVSSSFPENTQDGQELADFPSFLMSTKLLWKHEFEKIFLGGVFLFSDVIWQE